MSLTPEQIARRALFSVNWRTDHPDLSVLLDTMLPCGLSEEAEQALDNGYMPPKLQAALEQIIKPIIMAPMRESQVTGVAGSIHKAHFDVRSSTGEKFYRADFSTIAGWHGRIETTDVGTISTLTGILLHSQVGISGWVSWSVDSYAILVEPLVVVRLSE